MGGGANYTWIDCRQGTTVVNNIVMYPTYTMFDKNITAPAFVKDGGTSAQFLKANGSVDGNKYTPYSTASVATVNGTNYNTQIFNIENETLITGYGAYWNVVNLGSYSNGNFRTQLAMPYQNSLTDTELFIRSANNAAWRDWRRVIHVGNYASIIDARYVKKAGDTMTGALVTPRIAIGKNFGAAATAGNTELSLINPSDGSADTFLGCDGDRYWGITATSRTNPSIPLSLGLWNQINRSWALMITKDNDFGFGTTSPTATIHVRRPWSKNVGNWITLAVFDSDTAQAGQYYSLVMGARDSAKNRGMWYYYHAGDGSDNNRMTFCFQGVNSILNILASGKIGIGTTNPLDKVHVHDGSIRVSYAADDRCVRITPSTFRFISRTSGSQADEVGFRKSDDSAYLGIIGGAYAPSANSLSYLYYGGTSYTSPAMVILPNKNVGIGVTDPDYLLDVNSSIRARNGWLRQSGNYGWYNETHGGGWFMQDSVWVRTYNSKSVYTGSGQIRSDGLYDRKGYDGSSWNQGYGAYNVAIANNSAQTPLLLAYRSGYEATNATGANRLFSMEFLNAGTALRLYFGGVHRFTFYSNGNFESAGDQVSGSSSDRRLKQRFAVEDYTARIMRLGAVMDYEWSDKARALDPGKYDAVRHSSVVWQRARKVDIPGFCGVDGRGYGFVNWLNKDYQASLLGAVQETIRTVRRHDDEIRQLHRHVSELEGIVNNKCA